MRNHRHIQGNARLAQSDTITPEGMIEELLNVEHVIASESSVGDSRCEASV